MFISFRGMRKVIKLIKREEKKEIGKSQKYQAESKQFNKVMTYGTPENCSVDLFSTILLNVILLFFKNKIQTQTQETAETEQNNEKMFQPEYTYTYIYIYILENSDSHWCQEEEKSRDISCIITKAEKHIQINNCTN